MPKKIFISDDYHNSAKALLMLNVKADDKDDLIDNLLELSKERLDNPESPMVYIKFIRALVNSYKSKEEFIAEIDSELLAAVDEAIKKCVAKNDDEKNQIETLKIAKEYLTAIKKDNSKFAEILN